MSSTADSTRLQGLHCTMTLSVPAPGVLRVNIDGTDVGELGDAPFSWLQEKLEASPRSLELFVDAQDARGPSIDVSNGWALWLRKHRQRLVHISFLSSTRFVQLTANFVRDFAGLEDVMRIYTEPAAFEGAVSNAVGNARRLDRLEREG